MSLIQFLMNWRKDITPMTKYQISFTEKAKNDIGLKQSISQLQLFPYKFPIIQNTSLLKRNWEDILV